MPAGHVGRLECFKARLARVLFALWGTAVLPAPLLPSCLGLVSFC